MNCVKKRLGLWSVMTMMGLACLAPQTVYAEETPYNPQETTQTTQEQTTQEKDIQEPETEQTTQEQDAQEPETEQTTQEQDVQEPETMQTTQSQEPVQQTVSTPEEEPKPAPTPTIKLNRAKKSLERGDTFKLRAKIRKSSTKKIIWKSSKKRVATVNNRGVVTARNKGKTTITARIKGTNIKAKCVITVKKYITMWVRTTGYCNCSSCAGPWAGGATASGTMPKANHTIAVDKRLIPLGTKVKIGNEMYVAEDTGGAIKGKKIDVYYSSHGKAMAHGVKYQKIKVYI